MSVRAVSRAWGGGGAHPLRGASPPFFSYELSCHANSLVLAGPVSVWEKRNRRGRAWRQCAKTAVLLRVPLDNREPPMYSCPRGFPPPTRAIVTAKRSLGSESLPIGHTEMQVAHDQNFPVPCSKSPRKPVPSSLLLRRPRTACRSRRSEHTIPMVLLSLGNA